MRRSDYAHSLVFLMSVACCQPALPADTVTAARELGKTRPAVQRQPDGLYVCEAEEFHTNDAIEGWEAKPFGENYYAATFANAFLSRRAFLGAPPQCDESVATMAVNIQEAGSYLVLVRYEAAYRFQTQFRVQIEQAGQVVFDRLYGARENLKIWAFGQKLKDEVGWSWGAVENIVWEGHDAQVKLQPGIATIKLISAKQPEPAAKRNIDLVMLTSDTAEVQKRIEKERYLPLDGLLTQSGDVYLKVTNKGSEPLTFQGKRAPSGGNWQEHSPYWVHMRNWPKPSITVPPGKTSDWVEVGGTMDSLNHGQWFWTGNGPYQAEFAVRTPEGGYESIGVFSGEGDLSLAADCDTRYSKRLRTLKQVLFDLQQDLDQSNPAPHGHPPRLTPIYASTFTPLDDGPHAAAVREFKKRFALSSTTDVTVPGRGMIDVRGVKTDKLAEYCQKLGANAKNVAVVSLGDEIGLPQPRGDDAADAFHEWLKSQGLQPADVDPQAKNWDDVGYAIDDATKETKPGLYYWSKRFQYHYGIQAIKQRTDILRQHLPNAAIGANFSPHYPQEHMFLGEVFKWVTVFREDGMTLPWSEDYIWQLAVGSPQMNSINLDLFRAGLRHHPDRKIMYYVMPHMPNNTPAQWRRLFYSSLGHGMKMVNLFEFRPVQVAYTENHVDEPEMYRMVLRSFRELGLFEDIVQAGHVRSAQVGLWFSETGDIWDDNHGSLAAAKRALYIAIRNRQLPLDVVVEADALDGTLNQYKALYLCDAHVSSAASERIAAWVKGGGSLFATAGAGMFDERNQPNKVLRELLGVEQTAWEAPEDKQIIWIKQHLPFAEPLDQVILQEPLEASGEFLPVIGVRSRIQRTGGEIKGTFTDRSPAIVEKTTGKGRTVYCAFLPSLSYYYPAIPKRPVDRGANDDAMVHFLPLDIDVLADWLIAKPTTDLALPVQCNHTLVENTVIGSPQGFVIPLINWSGDKIANLNITLHGFPAPGKITLASGAPVQVKSQAGETILTLDIDVADAVIWRK